MQRFAVEILENVAIRAVLAHFKIVENHAFSQEGEGAQNCLCRKVGPFVEACLVVLQTMTFSRDKITFCSLPWLLDKLNTEVLKVNF